MTRWPQGATLVVSTAASLVLLLAPFGSGSPSFGTVLRPPFHGVVHLSSNNTSAGCSIANITTGPHFSLNSGVGGFAGSASSRSCAGHANDQANTDGRIGLVFSLPAKSGNRVVVMNWTFNVTGRESLKLGHCTLHPRYAVSYCDQLAAWNVYSSSLIYDLTAGLQFGSTNQWTGLGNESVNSTAWYQGGYWNVRGAGGAHGFSGSRSFSWSFNVANMNASHTYALYVELWQYSDAWCVGYHADLDGCSTSSSLNFANRGMGGTLHSISVS